MDIKTFGVVGAGQMGNGIAQVAAMSGLQVIMNDINTEFVEKGVATINKILSLLDRAAERRSQCLSFDIVVDSVDTGLGFTPVLVGLGWRSPEYVCSVRSM